MNQQVGIGSLCFSKAPFIVSTASVVGKKEGKVKITLQQTRDQHKSSSKALTAFFKTHKGNCVKDNLGLELNLVSKIYELLNSNSFSFSGARNYYNHCCYFGVMFDFRR